MASRRDPRFKFAEQQSVLGHAFGEVSRGPGLIYATTEYANGGATFVQDRLMRDAIDAPREPTDHNTSRAGESPRETQGLVAPIGRGRA